MNNMLQSNLIDLIRSSLKKIVKNRCATNLDQRIENLTFDKTAKSATLPPLTLAPDET